MSPRGSTLVALGALWGLALMAVQSLELSGAQGDPIAWSAVAWALPGWCVVGIAMAFSIELAAGWIERPLYALLSVAVASFALSGLWSGLYSIVSDWLPSSEWAEARLADPLGAFAYQAWLVAFYGGSYLLAWILHRRGVRSHAMLARIEISRLARRARADEARLAQLRLQIDPARLLETLREARRRITNGDASADTLLARLAAHLRTELGRSR
jgi:hypothetical protein